jgi:D-alanine--D-alanine ligase
MVKKTVAVFFGGKSPEHDVSIISALLSVVKPLSLLGYRVVPVYIAKNGNWYTSDELSDVKTYQTDRLEAIMVKQKPLQVSFSEGLVFTVGGLKKKRVKIDVAFPVMHGAYGEDGSLMGFLRMANVPFVGSDMESSVVAMNKVLAKQVVESYGIPTPKYVVFSKSEFEEDRANCMKRVNEKLKYPVFVKPPHLGSSIGISKVVKKEELENALEVAAYYDDVVLVEEGVQNLIEVTVPIIGNDEPRVSMVEKPLKTSDEFFDFESKYIGEGGKKGGKGKNGSQGYSEIPAKLPKGLYKKAEDVARDVYKKVGMSGISRVDLLIDEKTKEVYFNEINPMPGGLYAHNFAKNGISNVDLVDKLISYAEESFRKKQKTKTVFDTNYLKQF